MKGIRRRGSAIVGAGRTVIAFSAFWLALASVPAGAQELTLDDVKTYRPSFEYEQCANVCQIELDKSASACLNAELDAKQEVDGACLTAATDNNSACLKSCPVDTGDKRAMGLTAE